MENLVKHIDVEREHIGFPTLTACVVCGGIKGFAGREGTSEEAYLVALVQYGYYLKAWEKMDVANKKHFPYKCRCECDHDFIETPPTYMFKHHLQCTRCGKEIWVDTSG